MSVIDGKNGVVISTLYTVDGIADTLGDVSKVFLKLIRFRPFGVRGDLEGHPAPSMAFMNRLKARAEALVQEINRCNADLEKCHPLDRGFLTDRRNEAIAKHTGTMEAREIVAGLKNNLERLTGWHD